MIDILVYKMPEKCVNCFSFSRAQDDFFVLLFFVKQLFSFSVYSDMDKRKSLQVSIGHFCQTNNTNSDSLVKKICLFSVDLKK